MYRTVDNDQWHKIHVVHCGLESPASFRMRRPFLRMPKDLVCVSGGLCEQKGQLLLVDAVRLLRERGIYVCLTLGDGELRLVIEEQSNGIVSKQPSA